MPPYDPSQAVRERALRICGAFVNEAPLPESIRVKVCVHNLVGV